HLAGQLAPYSELRLTLGNLLSSDRDRRGRVPDTESQQSQPGNYLYFWWAVAKRRGRRNIGKLDEFRTPVWLRIPDQSQHRRSSRIRAEFRCRLRRRHFRYRGY